MKNHNKKISTTLFCAFMVVGFFGLIFCSCGANNSPSHNATCYDISLVFDDENSISVSQDVLYQAPKKTTLDEIVFHIYANAFDDKNNAITILSVQIDRQNVDFEIYGKNKTLLKIPCSLKENDICTLSFEYTLNLPRKNARLGITDDGTINLTCFYPVVAVYDNGWREDEFCDIGDPFYSEISSFFVSVECDALLSVACSGTKQLSSFDGKNRWTIEAENVRDFGMVIGKMQSASTSITLNENTVFLSYDYLHDNNPSQSLDRIASSITAFSRAFGEYPYSHFSIAQSRLDDVGGMEYGTFAIVSQSENREDYLNSITHEIAHQWWYNIVGNDQINTAWLDEGLCEFCTFYYHRLQNDHNLYSKYMQDISLAYRSFVEALSPVLLDENMNRPLNSFYTNGEYVAIVYLKGAMLFEHLRCVVGDAKFCNALKVYFESNRFEIATQKSLVDAFKTQGYDISPLLKSWTVSKI